MKRGASASSRCIKEDRMMGAKGKSALRSALDQATNDRVKILNLMTFS